MLNGLQTSLSQLYQLIKSFGSRGSHSNPQQFSVLVYCWSPGCAIAAVSPLAACPPPRDKYTMAAVTSGWAGQTLSRGSASMVWGLCPCSSGVPCLQHHQCPVQPGFTPSSRQSPEVWPTGSHQLTLCFHPRDQPQLLMLCHFPSHVLLRRHGRGPARFNIPENRTRSRFSVFPGPAQSALWSDQARSHPSG